MDAMKMLPEDAPLRKQRMKLGTGQAAQSMKCENLFTIQPVILFLHNFEAHL